MNEQQILDRHIPAVVAEYRANPPDDQVVVLESSFGEGRFVATWLVRTPNSRSGGARLDAVLVS